MASQYVKLPLFGDRPSQHVVSFNSRTGSVVSQAGDYSGSLISNTPAGTISSTDVQAAINELDGDIQTKQPIDAELTAISNLSVNGLITRTSSTTAAARTITAGSNITVTNGDGVSGNPTVALSGTVPVANGGTGTTTGSITGTGALTFAAGGTNQNVTLTPSGTGFTVLNGNVGIGTSVPSQLLDAQGNTGANLSIQVKNNGAGRSGLILDSGGTSDAFIQFSNQGVQSSRIGAFTGSGPAFVFSGTSAELVRISAGGNVGIGTNNPARTLDVNGQVLIRGEQGFDLRTRFIAGKAAGLTTNGALYLQFGQSDFVQVGDGTTASSFLVANGNIGVGTTSPVFNGGSGVSISRGTKATLRLEQTASSLTTAEIFVDNNGFNFQNLNSGRNFIFTTGNVGIGTTAPSTQLTNNTTGTSDAGGTGQTATSINWAANASGYVQALYNANTGSVANGLLIKGAGSTTNSLLSVDQGVSQGAAGTALFRVLGNGNVGIGTTTPGSTTHINGSFQIKLSALSANTTLDATYHAMTVDASGAARTITLPAASSTIVGRMYRIKKIDSSANAVSIVPTGTDTIDGAANYNLTTQNQFVTIVCSSATTWAIF